MNFCRVDFNIRQQLLLAPPNRCDYFSLLDYSRDAVEKGSRRLKYLHLSRCRLKTCPVLAWLAVHSTAASRLDTAAAMLTRSTHRPCSWHRIGSLLLQKARWRPDIAAINRLPIALAEAANA